MEIGRDDAILISDDGVIVISDEEGERTIILRIQLFLIQQLM